ncbi:MAG: hypothetical protein NZ555_13755, partial [Geminicoccaceae bacterium]|nr:hypothetical protein [Geminicoccaceae bacterium]MDW8371407.1 hypothetical protein [Geminicoccaceae bacterium]
MASIHETLQAGRKAYPTLLAADPPRAGLWRRIGVPAAIALVFLAFAGIVFLAWQDSFVPAGEPPIVRAPPGPIKRPPDTPGGVDVQGERDSVTSIAAGQPPTPKVERILPREPAPPRTLAEADPSLLAPPPSAST